MAMEPPDSINLRSPRESLGGYVLLPRLIDKVRLQAKGQLPPVYTANLLGSAQTLDGRFLAFTGLNAEELREAILANPTDEDVLQWVRDRARPATAQEKRCGRRKLLGTPLMLHLWNIGVVPVEISQEK